MANSVNANHKNVSTLKVYSSKHKIRERSPGYVFCKRRSLEMKGSGKYANHALKSPLFPRGKYPGHTIKLEELHVTFCSHDLLGKDTPSKATSAEIEPSTIDGKDLITRTGFKPSDWNPTLSDW